MRETIQFYYSVHPFFKVDEMIVDRPTYSGFERGMGNAA